MGVVDGKRVVITGAGGVIGSAFARALGAEGARIVCNDVDADRVDAIVSDLRGAGVEAVASVAPVDEWNAAGDVVGAATEHLGGIDALLNVAHTTGFGPIWSMTEADLDTTIGPHIKGHFACAHHAAVAMRPQGSGSIVTLGSRALNGHPGVSMYAAAKGAIMSATFSWALELAEFGIRVNAINPVAQHGDEPPARHMKWHWDFSVRQISWDEAVPAADTVAPLAVYLVSDASDWVTGQVLFLSGDTLALLRHPREERFAFRPEGWTYAEVEQHFRETIGASLEMPGMGVPRYPWYDGVGPYGP